jgi:putative tricarboxylic transport membrane protein
MGKSFLRNGDVVSGAVLSALGMFIFLEARKWNYTGPDGPGPGFFPTWYGLIMVALSLVMIVNAARTGQSGEMPATDWPALGRGLGTWAAFTASIAAMPVIGFTMSFALLTAVLVAIVFKRPLLVAALSGAGLAAAFYLVFVFGLDVALPTGFLGF